MTFEWIDGKRAENNFEEAMIKGFPNYTINTMGQVYSFKKKRYLKNSLDINKRLHIQLRNKKNERKNKLVHRLIAEAFIPFPLKIKKPQINHKDGVCTNNSISNLEWVTGSQNMLHAVRLGLIVLPDMSKPVSQFTKNNQFIANYFSAAEASRQTKVNSGHICNVANGRRITAGGFLWKRPKQ